MAPKRDTHKRTDCNTPPQSNVFVPIIQQEHSAHDSAKITWFTLALSSVFFLLELVNILHHAMWRDEIQVWSLSQRCHSLLQFLTLKRYEDLGHPDAWHLVVYPVSRFTSNPLAMQLLHLAIATLTVVVVARYSPFTRLQKILIVFGYFLFYEYATISRGYALGVLGIFVFCALFRPGPKKNYLLLAAVLGLAAQADIYAVILAIALVLGMLLEAIQAAEPRQYLYPSAARVGFAAALFVAAILTSVFRMRPPADSAFYPSWHFPVNPTGIGRTLAMMWKAFVPIPELSRHFWNTNIVGNQPAIAVLSIGVLCVSVLFFVRKPIALCAYASGIGAMLLFRHVKYAGDLRHDGHAWILFLACLWLAHAYPQESFPLPALDRMAGWFTRYENRTFLGLLVVQVVAAVIASAIAFEVPFSQARATANFLRSSHMDRMFIVGDPDAPLATLAGYLNRDIYYPRGDRMGTYIVWDTKRLAAPQKPILELGEQKAEQLHQNVLVILNHPAKPADVAHRQITSFRGSVVGSEDYYIYLVPYEAGANSPTRN